MAFNKDAESTVRVIPQFGIDSGYQLLPLVNATNAQKEEMGIKTYSDEDMEYVIVEDRNGIEVTTAIIELYAKAVKSPNKVNRNKVYPLQFRISNTLVPVSSKDTYKFINKYGQTTYGQAGDDNPDNVAIKERYYVTTDGGRISYQGEGEIENFLRMVFGIKVEDLAVLDTEKLFAGNFEEISTNIDDIIVWKTDPKKEGNPDYKFSLLHFIKTTEKVTEAGVKTYYNMKVTQKYGTYPDGIRKNLDKQETYELSAGKDYLSSLIYKHKGIVPSYLVDFDATSLVDLSDTTTDGPLNENLEKTQELLEQY